MASTLRIEHGIAGKVISNCHVRSNQCYNQSFAITASEIQISFFQSSEITQVFQAMQYNTIVEETEVLKWSKNKRF